MSGAGGGAGRVLAGRYRVVGLLGRGGMGTVYRAVDEVLGREVAVKELRAFTDASAAELADLCGRMRREARAAARVRHTGVIAVHDVVEHDGLPVIVMEWVDGPSLDDVLRDHGALDPREAARIGAKVAEALAAAHDAGVLHRDVKPGNVLLAGDGRVVLTDFGIATVDEHTPSPLTMSGQLVGSLDFLSPERAQGHTPGPASDVWSLGAMLFAAVEGTSPFGRAGAPATLRAIAEDPLPPTHRAGSLTPVLRALLAKDPQARPDARQAGERLASFANTARQAPPGAMTAPAVAAEPPTVPQAEPARGPFAPATPPFAHRPARPAPPVPAPGWRPPPMTGTGAGAGPGQEAATLRLVDGNGRRRTAIGVTVAAIVLVGGGVTWAVSGGSGGNAPGHPLAGPSMTASAGPAASTGSAGSPVTASSPSPNRPRAAHATTDPTAPGASGGPHGSDRSNSGTGNGGSGSATHGGSQPAPTAAPKPKPRPAPTKPPAKPKPAPGASCTYYSGTATTQYGDTGSRVKEVQCILLARGYSVGSGGMDGQFGKDTKAGVEAFQKSEHLEVDGQVGPLTWSALRR
ncbi:protein kinase [Streptomyces sp. SL13]|uniref:non-specific serine/threonine protein kinase n=1 Tax=Streptantibioticus silvisoli TaxID=2705255 RepID=A0AA90HD23_9ACTN|nr:protein kinase [Streptantibioticus silvisoli]MDI5974434.1 protein kinase [Streptantibioticus silvisoli]